MKVCTQHCCWCCSNQQSRLVRLLSHLPTYDLPELPEALLLSLPRPHAWSPRSESLEHECTPGCRCDPSDALLLLLVPLHPWHPRCKSLEQGAAKCYCQLGLHHLRSARWAAQQDVHRPGLAYLPTTKQLQTQIDNCSNMTVHEQHFPNQPCLRSLFFAMRTIIRQDVLG